MTEQPPPKDNRPWLLKFLFPKLTPFFFLRLILVVAVTYGFFGYLCIPAWTNGVSMEPLYPNKKFLLCWTPAYWTRSVERGEVVMIKYGGTKVMLLKRVVAVAGDTLEFRDGYLYINDEKVEEPWAHLTDCNWNMSKHTVAAGHVYVIGDNRSMPMEEHIFGEVETSKIAGMSLMQ